MARLADLPDGKLLSVDFDGVRVLLANSGDTVYAVRDQCTHEDRPLSEGELEDDDSVSCPWHLSRFCLRTGAALDSPAYEPVETFVARVDDGAILLSRNGGTNQ